MIVDMGSGPDVGYWSQKRLELFFVPDSNLTVNFRHCLKTITSSLNHFYSLNIEARRSAWINSDLLFHLLPILKRNQNATFGASRACKTKVTEVGFGPITPKVAVAGLSVEVPSDRQAVGSKFYTYYLPETDCNETQQTGWVE